MSREQEDAPIKDEKRSSEPKPDANKGTQTTQTSQKTVNPQIVISFIVVFIFAVFAIVNTQEVSISFVFTEVEIPLIIVILGSFILGALTTALTSWRSRRKKTKG